MQPSSFSSVAGTSITSSGSSLQAIKEEHQELPLTHGLSDVILVDQMPPPVVPIASHHKINNYAPLWQAASLEVKQEIESAPNIEAQTFFEKKMFTKRERQQISDAIEEYKNLDVDQRAEYLETRMQERQCDGSIPGLRGKEVIAVQDILKAELLGHYAGILEREPEEKPAPSHTSLVIDAYALGIAADKYVSGFKTGNITSRINSADTYIKSKGGKRKKKLKHSNEATPKRNVAVVTHKINEALSVPFIVATAPIKAAETLWLDYGKQYWCKIRGDKEKVLQQTEVARAISSDEEELSYSKRTRTTSESIGKVDARPIQLDKVEKKKSQKQQHIAISSVQTYSCKHCSKSFNRRYYLNRHLLTHTGKKPFACEKCQATFTVSSGLKRHQRKHTGERPYPCSLCTMQFMTSRDLQRHLYNLHSKAKPFPCSQCEKSFITKTELSTHTMCHTGEKPYSCTECNNKFTSRGNLNKHKRTHTGEKPYSCTICDKAFSIKLHLVEHQRIHTGEKPFACSYCNKRFSHKINLTVHHRTHTGEKPYGCSHCGKQFGHLCSLKIHQQIHDRDQSTSPENKKIY